MTKLLRQPKVQLALLLVLIYVSAVLTLGFFSNLKIFIFAIISVILSDLFFSYLRKRVLFIPYSAVVTGIVISLVASPSATLHQITIISILAIASKNFVLIKNRHIFNPAAFGLFFGGIIFQLPVAWWGASFQYIIPFNVMSFLLFLILLSPLYVSAYRLKRYYSIFAFIASYTVFVQLFTKQIFSFADFFQILIDPTTLFFAIVMLVEPMTSPMKQKNQLKYGVLVGLMASFFSISSISSFLDTRSPMPSVYLAGLLLGNFYNAKFLNN